MIKQKRKDIMSCEGIGSAEGWALLSSHAGRSDSFAVCRGPTYRQCMALKSVTLEDFKLERSDGNFQ